jgi:hypothetical protein
MTACWLTLKNPCNFTRPRLYWQPMDPASDTPASIAFGRFGVLPHRREFLDDGLPIKLGGRAFDLPMALI